ncbi:hypothetical protein [Novosphingobium sp. Leaf2]|uniref:hypothetical protein n=1 Tax=Novosphingobium sp. Leaf2 TaxID=1735670 RepID=UPI000ACE0C30|nr:hypothetical protein [Novosphingobium sp. Leaf2]
MDQVSEVLTPFVAFGWIALVVGMSIIYRIRVGKPIYPRIPTDAVFAERWASGPFALNCLLVSVTSDGISVVPKFPFNLMFLSEFYGLERCVPITTIQSVEQTKSLFRNNVLITYGKDRKTLRLRLSKPGQFLTTIRKLQNSVGIGTSAFHQNTPLR